MCKLYAIIVCFRGGTSLGSGSKARAKISPRLEARRAWFLKKLEVSSSLKFPDFIKEKLGLEVVSMTFFAGSGLFGLDPQNLKLVSGLKKNGLAPPEGKIKIS